MGYCKLILASILFFGGIFGQLRFQRHLNSTATTTQNGLEQGLTGMNGLSLDDVLNSDNGDHGTVGDVVLQDSYVTVEVELLTANGELEFQMCPYKCMGTKVSVCYEAGRIDDNAKGVCGPNQCEFVAGAYKESDKDWVWFMNKYHSYKEFSGKQCPSVAMKYNNVEFYQITQKSCDPVKRGGKIVTLYVRGATKECSIKVLNAKRWFPTTTAPPTTALPPLLLSTSVSTESSTSNADSTWWIVGGILAGFFVLLIIGGIGFCVYQRHQQKKAAAEKAERKRRVISPESLPTLDLSPYVQKEEEVKKHKTEKKKKCKKVEPAPAPAKVMPAKKPTTEEPKIGPSEPTTEDRTKVEASKEKAAPEIKEVKKETKAPPAKESTMNVQKHDKKDVPAVAAPPPPRPKPATPKQRTVDTTQEETSSLEKPQAAFEDGSSSPSMENKAPKKPAKKTPAKKPPPRPSHLRHVSKKAPRHQRYPWRMNSEEWKDYQEQLRLYPRSKVIEWNSKSSSNHR